MTKIKIEGNCSICGTVGALSREHVPPKSAYNNRRFFEIGLDEALNLKPDGILEKPFKNQGGKKFVSICEACNNNTGAWYASEFVKFCQQGMDILERSGGHPTLLYLYNIRPLLIIKQIVTMFFSVNDETFRCRFPELEPFVLDKCRKYLPPQYRFFVYYNPTNRFRYASFTAVGDIISGRYTWFSEISHAPYGYIMVAPYAQPDKKPIMEVISRPPDYRLVEITHFSEYGYNDRRSISLRLPVLSMDSPLPGDYRTKDELLHAVQQANS